MRVVAKIGLWSAADWGSKFSASVLALMSRMMLNPQLPARQKNSPPGPGLTHEALLILARQFWFGGNRISSQKRSMTDVISTSS
jgi:hypothetical protein